MSTHGSIRQRTSFSPVSVQTKKYPYTAQKCHAINKYNTPQRYRFHYLYSIYKDYTILQTDCSVSSNHLLLLTDAISTFSRNNLIRLKASFVSGKKSSLRTILE